MGATVSSAPNLLLAFRASLPVSILLPVTDTLQKWPVTATSRRLLELGSRRLWALCTDNASVMVSMRKMAEADGLVLASYDCFAHAVNLVGKELCARPPFARMLKLIIAATFFFRRCTRARADMTNDRATQKAAGNKVNELRTFSPTRWVGQSLTLRAFIDNLPGLRRVLLFNSHRPPSLAFAVPPTVAEAINDGAIEATANDLLPCLQLLFRLSASLEADACPLSSVLGLFAAFCIVLRGNLFGALGAARSFLSKCLMARFSSYSHPLMVLAFYLDPFYAPCRQQVGVDLWGGEHLPVTRRRAVHSLCDGDDALEQTILRELGSFLRHTNVRTAALSGRTMHPATWWELYGTQWPTLHFLANRLFFLPTSSAASERTFKALSVILSQKRNRTLDDKVDKQWKIIVNQKQLRRGDIIGEYVRSSVEQLLLRLVDGGDVADFGGAHGGLVVHGAPDVAADSPPPLEAGGGMEGSPGAPGAPAPPPRSPAGNGGEGAVGDVALPDGGVEEGVEDVEDAVAAALAALDGPVAPGGQPIAVAAAVAHALAQDAAAGWPDEVVDDCDDESPIELGDLDAIVESFFDM